MDADAGFTLLQTASRTRAALDATLHKLSNEEVTDEAASVATSATYRTAVSTSRARRPVSVASSVGPGTRHRPVRTVFLPFRIDVGPDAVDTGFAELERVANGGDGLVSSSSSVAGGAGDVEVDGTLVQKGLAGCTEVKQVLAILADWVFPADVDSAELSGQQTKLLPRSSPGQPHVHRYGRVLSLVDVVGEESQTVQALLGPVQVQGQEEQGQAQQGSLALATASPAGGPCSYVIQGEVCYGAPRDTALARKAGAALLSVEPGLGVLLQHSSADRLHSTDKGILAASKAVMERTDKGLLSDVATRALARTCLHPTLLTALPDPDLALPTLVTADVGTHGEGKGHGAGLTIAVPFVYVVRDPAAKAALVTTTAAAAATAGAGEEGEEKEEEAGEGPVDHVVGRLMATVVMRAGFTGVATAATNGILDGPTATDVAVTEVAVELSWHPGGDEESSRRVLATLDETSLAATVLAGELAAAAGGQDKAGSSSSWVGKAERGDAKTFSGLLAQLVEDARALRRGINRRLGTKGKGGGAAAGGAGAPGSSSAVERVKTEVRAQMGKALRRALKRSSATHAHHQQHGAGRGPGSVVWEDEDGADWSVVDPRSLTPVPPRSGGGGLLEGLRGPVTVEDTLVELLDQVSTGQASMHGAGVGASSLYTPRPLAQPGVPLAREGWKEGLPGRDSKGKLAKVAGALAKAGGQDDAGTSADASTAGSVPTAYTMLWSWGKAEHGCLGLGPHGLPRGAAATGSVPIPTPLPFAGDLGGWRVVSVACGWYHTVVLTDTGNVYTWGSGADGQLGHGPEAMGIDCPSPRLLDFFGLQHPLRVTAIAAGSDASGSHTLVVARGLLTSEQAADPEETQAKARAALGDGLRDATFEGEEAQPGDDEDAAGPGRSLPPAARTGTAVADLGRVYAWGAGVGTGTGSQANVAVPTLLRSGASDMYTPAQGGVLAVAAGGGFGMALTRAGGVYSWGKYAEGRLGLGTPPESRHKGQGNEKRYLHVSLTPLRLARGWAWRDAPNAQPLDEVEEKGEEEQDQEQGDSPSGGSNAAAGASSSSSSAAPKKLKAPSNPRPVGAVPNLYGPPTVPVRSISAGEAHALAVDVWGLLWSWGRGFAGATGLGHTGDALIPQRLTAYVPGDDPATGLAPVKRRDKAIDVVLEEEEGEGEGQEEEGEGVDEASFEDAQDNDSPTAAGADGGASGSSRPVATAPAAAGGAARGAAAAQASTNSRSHLRRDSVLSSASSIDSAGTSASAMGGASSVRSVGVAPPRPVRFVRVFAGIAHSLAIDVAGGLWTWGGGGGAMLGHADEELRAGADIGKQSAAVPALAARLRARQARLRSRGLGRVPEEEGVDDRKAREQAGDDEGEGGEDADGMTAGDTEEADSIAKQELVFKQPWIVPRRLRSLDGKTADTAVAVAGGGAAHSFAVTTAGRMLVWGFDTTASGSLGRAPTLDRTTGAPLPAQREPLPRLLGCTSELAADQSGELPLLGSLTGETITAVGTGAWHTIAVTPLGGNAVGTGLRNAWSLASAFAPADGRKGGAGPADGATDAASAAATSTILSPPASMAAIHRPGVKGYDTLLVVDGGRAELKAHAAILSARLPALADRIATEALPGRVTRLFLPGLTYATAVRVLEWVYTGGLALPIGLEPGAEEGGAGAAGGAARRGAAGHRGRLPREEAANVDPSALAMAAESLGLADLAGLATVHAEAPLRYWLRSMTTSPAKLLEQDEDEDEGGMLVAPPQARQRQAQAAIALAASTFQGTLARDLLRLLLGEAPGIRPAPGLTPFADLLVFVHEAAPDPLAPDLPPATWCLPVHAVVVCAASDYLRATLLGPTGAGWDAGLPAAGGGKDGASSLLTGGGEVHGKRGPLGGFGGPLELVLPDSPMTVARLLTFVYTGCLPALPLSAASASDDGVGPTPGVRLPWRRLVKPLEEAQAEADEDESGDGIAALFAPWEGEEGGVYAVPRTYEPWDHGGQLLLDAGAGERYGLPRLTALAEAMIEVTPSRRPTVQQHKKGGRRGASGSPTRTQQGRQGQQQGQGQGADGTPFVFSTPSKGSSEVPVAAAAAAAGMDPAPPLVYNPPAVSAAEALAASINLPLPRLREAASVAALSDLPAATSDPSWAAVAGGAPGVVTELMDRALDRNDSFFKILAQEAAKTSVARARPVQEVKPRTVLGTLAGIVMGEVEVPGGKLPLGPLVILFLLFLLFLTLAEYNTAMSEAVPYVNGGALLLAVGMAYYGFLTT